MKNKILYFFLSFFLTIPLAFSQIGVGTISPDSSAILDVESTKKGFLLPRLTFTQRESIDSPAEGLMIYNKTVNCIETYTGSNWWNLCTNENYNVLLNIDSLICTPGVPLDLSINNKLQVGVNGITKTKPVLGFQMNFHSIPTVNANPTSGWTLAQFEQNLKVLQIAQVGGNQFNIDVYDADGNEIPCVTVTSGYFGFTGSQFGIYYTDGSVATVQSLHSICRTGPGTNSSYAYISNQEVLDSIYNNGKTVSRIGRSGGGVGIGVVYPSNDFKLYDEYDLYASYEDPGTHAPFKLKYADSHKVIESSVNTSPFTVHLDNHSLGNYPIQLVSLADTTNASNTQEMIIQDCN